LSHALAHALVPLQVRAEMRHRAEEALLHASSDAEAAAAAAAAEAAARAQQQAEEEALHMEARRAKLQREGARQAALDQRAEADGARAFPSCMRSVLTEILPMPRLFLSRNIEDGKRPGSAAAAAKAEARVAAAAEGRAGAAAAEEALATARQEAVAVQVSHFRRVHWVAVPQALRARRVNRSSGARRASRRRRRPRRRRASCGRSRRR
jgi:hypothetical protein